MARIPVTILTGFLGAGKTTFLNRLLSEPGFDRTAVIVNEFGEAGVDGSLVTRADEGVVEMTVGCLCCTVSGDVRQTLFRLLDEQERGVGPSFDRVVIETTGLADPVPILQTFMTSEAMLHRFALNGVVTLLDAVNAEHGLERFEEARRQVAVADLLLITKGDLAQDPASKRDLADLKADLSWRNPNARVMDVHDAHAETVFSLAAFDPSGKPPDVREFLRFETAAGGHADHGHAHGHGHGHAHDVNRHGETATAYCFTADEPVDLHTLGEAIAALQASFGSDLLRVKGLVEIADEPSGPLILHAVGHATSPPALLDGWPEGIEGTRIVLILSGPMRAEATPMLASFLPELRPFGVAPPRPA
ncbi:MAG: GTP-binding protein [Pseudomonadota bacterium]